MLAKCANPECSHVFRYLGTGKLYRLAAKLRQGQTNAATTMEHFWLCPDCVPTMILALGRDGKAMVMPRRHMRAYREAGGRISPVPEVSPEVRAF